MDILQRLPIEKWTMLRDSLKRDWPAYAYHYNYVENSIKWKRRDATLKIEFYCPYGRIDSGVFVSASDQGRVSLLLFSFDECRDLLRQVLRTTNRINWSETFLFACVHENVRGLLTEFFDGPATAKGLRRYTVLDNYTYFKSKEDCLNIQLQIPGECELRRIDETYVPLIHSLWPHRDSQHPEKSLEFLRIIARLNGGYGLFLKEDGKLVSWILQCNLGCLGMLQTLDEHKRKGYGKTVARALAKHLAEREDLEAVTLFVVETNHASRRLFESMDFQPVAATSWYHVNP